MRVPVTNALPARALTAERLVDELLNTECASVLVVGTADGWTARKIVRERELELKVHVDPKRLVGQWELF